MVFAFCSCEAPVIRRLKVWSGVIRLRLVPCLWLSALWCACDRVPEWASGVRGVCVVGIVIFNRDVCTYVCMCARIEWLR